MRLIAKVKSLKNMRKKLSKPFIYVRDGIIQRSLRVQLIITFLICLVIAWSVSAVSYPLLGHLTQKAYIDYTHGIKDIDQETSYLVIQISNYDKQFISQQALQAFFKQATESHKLKIFIVDSDGKVLLKSNNAAENQIYLQTVMQKALDNRYSDRNTADSSEYTTFYPVQLGGITRYLIVSGNPRADIIYKDEASPLAVFLGIISFLVLFYFLTKRKINYIEELAAGLLVISKGDLDYRVARKGKDELGSLAHNINLMTQELQTKIEGEKAIEKAKNDLITNVSHDLRTPLTSIMGYLQLLMDKRYENDSQLEEYIRIAYGKSEGLKGLIEDLFQYTKISNHNVVLNRRAVCMNDFLEQFLEEFIPICEENTLSVSREITESKVYLELDSDLFVRVLENLFSNAIQYSNKPGEIQLKMTQAEKHIIISVQNRGKPVSKDDLPHLFERFYRIEPSRSASTGGSGLGLAIVKSIVELHGGEIWAESEGEEIKFLIRLTME